MATIAIFCNHCFRDKEFDQGLFYISSCYHILCAGCRGSSGDSCVCCNQICQFLEINNNLPAHVKAYFMMDMTDQRSGSVSKIWKFQTQQYRIWMHQHGHRTVENCNRLIKEAEANNLRRQKLNERLQQEVEVKRNLDDAMRAGKIPIDLLKIGVDSLKARNIVFGFSWLKKKPSPVTLFKSAIKNNYKFKKSGFNKF